MTAKKRDVLVCGAWPYANGSLHVGHVAALIAGDIVARYHRLNGDDVLYVSGSDQHGTPIAVRAETEGVSPATIANGYHDEFVDCFERLGFTYDLYSKTSDPDHARVVQEFFLDLYHKGAIYSKTQEFPYCQKDQRFLPDRYVEGKCPKCGAEEARGDQCDICGQLLDSTELIDPKCKICGTTPVLRESEHFYLKLSEFAKFLQEYIKTEGKKGYWRPNAINFSLGLIKAGLPDRSITRDTDWGIEIPLHGYESKRIYVWFEAVLGYVSTSIKWAKSNGKPDDWKRFWSDDSRRVFVHGKDNIPFHTIILPSILHAKGDLALPSQILSTEYVTLEGKQFSTSRDWAIWIPDYLERYDPDCLRYHCIINGPETADSNFSWLDFLERTNADLVGVYGNFVHRVLSFILKNYGNKIPEPDKLSDEDQELLKAIPHTFKQVAADIEKGHLRRAVKNVFSLARLGNQYLEKKSPWLQIKEDKEAAGTTLWVSVQVIGALASLTQPFIPRSSGVLAKTLNLNKLEWKRSEISGGHSFNTPEPLFKHLEKEIIDEELARLNTSK